MAEGVEEGAAITCDHLYSSIHDPSLPLQWVRQCMVCGGFDGDSMREEIGKFIASREDVQEALTRYDAKAASECSSPTEDMLAYALQKLIDLGCIKDDTCTLSNHVIGGSHV